MSRKIAWASLVLVLSGTMVGIASPATAKKVNCGKAHMATRAIELHQLQRIEAMNRIPPCPTSCGSCSLC